MKQTNGVWLKTNGEILSNYEVQILNEGEPGDCMIADESADFKHRIVDCNLKFSVSSTHFCKK